MCGTVDKILMKQRGVALITALLVVALVTTLSVAWMTRQELIIRRTANLLHHDQAYFYSLGGEAWARLLLQQDDLTVDTLKETWAMRLPVMPIDGGTLQGELNDLQGRFNLNNLLTDSGEVSQADVARLERLLLALEVSPILVQTIVDWLDRDATPQLPSGAEDTFYLGQKPSYRAANRLMVDPNELRAVAGVTPEIFETLRPYITALPKRTLLNINTASLPLLRTVAPEITQAEAETLIALRETEPFVSVQAFAKQDVLAGHRVEMDNLSVTSQYFLYLGEAHIDRGRARLQSVLQREGNQVIVLARSQE